MEKLNLVVSTLMIVMFGVMVREVTNDIKKFLREELCETSKRMFDLGYDSALLVNRLNKELEIKKFVRSYKEFMNEDSVCPLHKTCNEEKICAECFMESYLKEQK